MSKLFSRWWLKIEIFRNLWMQIILYPKKKSYFFYFSPKFINHISILFAGTYISVIWDRSNNLPPNETNEWKLYESNETVFFHFISFVQYESRISADVLMIESSKTFAIYSLHGASLKSISFLKKYLFENWNAYFLNIFILEKLKGELRWANTLVEKFSVVYGTFDHFYEFA